MNAAGASVQLSVGAHAQMIVQPDSHGTRYFVQVFVGIHPYTQRGSNVFFADANALPLFGRKSLTHDSACYNVFPPFYPSIMLWQKHNCEDSVTESATAAGRAPATFPLD